jgi:transcriptional regulator with XRE-family HTH domain
MAGIDGSSNVLFPYPFFDGSRTDQWLSVERDSVQEVVPPSAQADPALFSGDLDGLNLLDPLFPNCDGPDDSPDLSPSPRHDRLFSHPISSGDEHVQGPAEKVRVIGGKLLGAKGLTSGPLLHVVRKAFGLTQKQLGSRINLSKNQVCAYEKGASISLKTSKTFANCFGIDDFRVFCSVRKESTVSVKNGQLVGVDGLKAGAIVRALRKNLGLTPSELSERIGGVPGGHAIATLETTNRVGQPTAQLFAQAFGLKDCTVLLPKKPKEIVVEVMDGEVIGGEELTPGRLLVALRKGYPGGDLSQTALGNRVKISQSQVSRYELGYLIAKEDSTKLAVFFGITNTEIFYSTEGPRILVEDGQSRGAEMSKKSDAPRSTSTSTSRKRKRQD